MDPISVLDEVRKIIKTTNEEDKTERINKAFSKFDSEYSAKFPNPTQEQKDLFWELWAIKKENMNTIVIPDKVTGKCLYIEPSVARAANILIDRESSFCELSFMHSIL